MGLYNWDHGLKILIVSFTSHHITSLEGYSIKMPYDIKDLFNVRGLVAVITGGSSGMCCGSRL